MGTIDEILRLQKQAKKLQKRWREADRVSDNLLDHYGDLGDIDARIDEIDAALAEIITVAPEEHPEFDSRHKVTRTPTGRLRWDSSLLEDCEDCIRIEQEYGLRALRDERKWLKKRRKELSRALDQYEDLPVERDELLSEINELAVGLSLPTFQAAFDESTGFTGFIIGTGDIANFTIRGRPILDSGTYVEYQVGEATYYIALDDSEQIVAHYTGSGGWHLTGLGRRMVQSQDEDTTVKTQARFSYDKQAPTTDIVIIPRGDKTGSHHHIVIDDDGNVVTDEWRDR